MCTVLAEHGITISASTYYEQVWFEVHAVLKTVDTSQDCVATALGGRAVDRDLAADCVHGVGNGTQ